MADITGIADSLAVRSVDEAFLSGRLLMSPDAAADLAGAPHLWSDALINCGLVSATIILAILCISQLIEVFPIVFAGIFRTKPVLSFESNVRLGKERDMVAWVAYLALCLIFARFDVISLRFMEKFPFGISTLFVIGIMLAYMMLRMSLIKAFEPKRRGKEYYMASNNLYFNFLILLAGAMCATVLFCLYKDMNDLIVRRILLYEIVGTAALLALRKLEILSNYCNLFLGFLYLCALEIFPAGLLIAASLLF